MFSFLSQSKTSYETLPRSQFSGTDKEEEESLSTHAVEGISYRHAVFLYTSITVLAISLLTVLVVGPHASKSGELGSFETGFKTEIVPDMNTLALQKTKFYGGIIISENGTYSLSHAPGTPDYFGLPSSETDHAWGHLLKDRFIGLPPKDWPPGALQPNLERDLVRDKWWAETSGLHGLHCLNYVRRSFHPEYYPGHQDQPGEPEAEPRMTTHSMHLKHCFEQIRQHLMCQLDMTPTPRTWRPAAKVHHADTDQWHVCRNFEAMRNWMHPLEEHLV